VATTLTDLQPDEIQAIQDEAASGNPAALYIIGMGYCRADGLPCDYSKGVAMLQQSALLGYQPAIRELELLRRTFSSSRRGRIDVSIVSPGVAPRRA
jgi:TPR repeat protein